MVSSQQSSGSIFCQSKKSHFDPFYRLFGTSVNSDLADISKTHLLWVAILEMVKELKNRKVCSKFAL